MDVHMDIYLITTIYLLQKISFHEIMPFAATWMDLEIIIQSEASQTEKDKYRII